MYESGQGVPQSHSVPVGPAKVTWPVSGTLTSSTMSAAIIAGALPGCLLDDRRVAQPLSRLALSASLCRLIA